MRVVTLIATVFLATIPAAFAQTEVQRNVQNPEQTQDQEQKKSAIYEWTDNKGVVHITDRLEKVPERYRSSARRVEAPAGEENETEEQGISPSIGYSGEEERETEQKAYWQGRIKSAKQDLVRLEGHYRDLDQKRTELLGSWGGVAGGHLEDRAEAVRIEQEMKQVQQEIDNTRNQIEVVIPDEARKAGIPPGWLRE
ncbi:MAG: DUF4124 domain-containing protein [Nitrospiraceae bacterium]|nr:DUF4124 domain-containing protein [Nitrospiraceae bacterium]